MRLTTRSIATAQAIEARQDFTTSGSLAGHTVNGVNAWDSGWLAGADLEKFNDEAHSIGYVVTSYATPIAWWTPNGWHVVAQKFSQTTTKHQGNLYLIAGK